MTKTALAKTKTSKNGLKDYITAQNVIFFVVAHLIIISQVNYLSQETSFEQTATCLATQK